MKPFYSIIWSFGIGLFLLSCSQKINTKPFTYRIAILGNPTNPDIRYDQAQMSALKSFGFNTIQLNIAWGARPADEPLNLEDILYVPGVGDEDKVNKRLEIIKYRARIAKQWGFRTLFHFGAPRVDPPLYTILSPDLIDIATEKYSIQKKEIVDLYTGLLKRLKKEIPEIDDVQIYTFDQEAWVANEFGNGPTDCGIPLHERIPPFLQALTKTWAEVSPNGMLWWEPWELSAGQIYACIPYLPTKNFGMFLHSNIAEVQLSRPIDVWFKNMVFLLAERNIPVVGEIFMSSSNEETQPLEHISTPRLVGEEIDAMSQFKTLCGIKEYFGLIPDRYDPNISMAGLKINNPTMSNEDAIRQLAVPFRKDFSNILKAWELSSQGLALFPWDGSWSFRNVTDNLIGLKVFHYWDKAYLQGGVPPSPSWKSTRRSLFMITEFVPYDPWLFEDIELRCAASVAKLQEAIDYYERIDHKGLEEKYITYLTNSITDFRRLEQIITAFRCYCRECNLAYMMRKYVQKDEPIPDHLIQRFEDIMAIDITNQNKNLAVNQGQATASEMLALFRQDPAEWVIKHLRN